MILYPITSILRTSTGIIPIFNIVPNIIGNYELSKPLIVFSGNKTIVVNKINVVGRLRGTLLSSYKGYYIYASDTVFKPVLFEVTKFPLSGMNIPGITINKLIQIALKAVVSCHTLNISGKTVVRYINKNMPEYSNYIDENIVNTANFVGDDLLHMSSDNMLYLTFLFLRMSFYLKKLSRKNSIYNLKSRSNWWILFFKLVFQSIGLSTILRYTHPKGSLLFWNIPDTTFKYFIKYCMKTLRLNSIDRFILESKVIEDPDIYITGSDSIKVSSSFTAKKIGRNKKYTNIGKYRRIECSTYFVELKGDKYLNKHLIELNGVLPK